MNPAELIARLEGRVTVLESLGGDPEIEQEDISHAMARIDDRLAVDLIRAKYGLNSRDHDRLLGRFYFDANVLANKRHWKLDRPGILLEVCKVVLSDFLHSHVCEVCMGRKHAIVNGALVICQNCNGAGFKYPTDQNRAERIGINEKYYRQVWARRFAQLMADLAGREITALSIMSQVLE